MLRDALKTKILLEACLIILAIQKDGSRSMGFTKIEQAIDKVSIVSSIVFDSLSLRGSNYYYIYSTCALYNYANSTSAYCII